MATTSLPALETPGFLTRAVALLSIVAAVVLLAVHALRLVVAASVLPNWMLLLAVLLVPLAMLTADVLSGLVHWFADTWGHESMPVLGHRLLRPFRVHHINPDDFLRRHWIDTNGDVATIVAVVLLLALRMPLHTVGGWCASLFVVVLAAVTLPTNQVHQWAHMRHPPMIISWLQLRGVLLSHPQHALHHAPPYLTNYCIALGWANGVLVRVQAFPRLERLVTRLTGVQPRADESSNAVRQAAATNS